MTSDGCYSSSNSLNLTITTLSELDNPLSVNLYPNPNSGLFTLEFETDIEVNVKIIDAIGKLVFEGKNYTSKMEVDMNTLLSGIYFVQVTSRNRFKVLPFIVSK